MNYQHAISGGSQSFYQQSYQSLIYNKRNPALDMPTLDEDEVERLRHAFNLYDAKGKGLLRP